jgi:hypothetical protein
MEKSRAASQAQNRDLLLQSLASSTGLGTGRHISDEGLTVRKKRAHAGKCDRSASRKSFSCKRDRMRSGTYAAMSISRLSRKAEHYLAAVVR